MFFLRSVARAPWLPLVARVFLAIVFVVSGFEKLQNFQGTVQNINALTSSSVGLILSILVILFELGGGLMLLANWHTELALEMLVVFLIVATILVHANLSDPTKVQMNLQQLQKNLAILGGLLLMARMYYLETDQA